MTQQNPQHGAHLRHPVEIARLSKHIEHFTAVGDEDEAAVYTARKEATEHRLACVTAVKPFVDSLGLSHEISKSSVTYNDALNYAAKTLQEHRYNASGKFAIAGHHARSGHGALVGVNDGAHCDEAKLTESLDSSAELIAHLGLTDATQIAAAKALFAEQVAE